LPLKKRKRSQRRRSRKKRRRGKKTKRRLNMSRAMISLWVLRVMAKTIQEILSKIS
jgi:hypothetical protein